MSNVNKMFTAFVISAAAGVCAFAVFVAACTCVTATEK